MEEYLEEIEMLSAKTSFRKDSLLRIKWYYGKYINNKHNICMSCPGSINHMINVFKAHKEILIRKIIAEYGE